MSSDGEIREAKVDADTFKGEKSDKVLGHMVGEIPPQIETQQTGMRRMSMVDRPEVSRHGSIDSNINSEAMAKASASVQPVPSPATVPPSGEQGRRGSWWRRSSSTSSKDMENFIHMAFSAS